MVTLISLQSGKESRERFSLRSSCRLDHLSKYYWYCLMFLITQARLAEVNFIPILHEVRQPRAAISP